MLLAERGWLDQVDLVATDLSRKALDRARRGLFSRRSIRDRAPAGMVARWLREREGGFEVDRRLIDAVTWSRLNLIDRDAIAALGRFDLVLCRNALIYFTDERSAEIARSLAGALRPGGALLVGVSESLLRFAVPLECQERRGSFLYGVPEEP